MSAPQQIKGEIENMSEQIKELTKDEINQILTTDIKKKLRDSIVVKPTGKFFVVDGNQYPFTTDPRMLIEIVDAINRHKQSKLTSGTTTNPILFPLLYVGNPGTGKTYQAQELARATGRPFLRIGFKFGINFESILREYDKELGWKYSEFYNYLTGTDPVVVLFDEFNIHGVDQKSFQILLDDQVTIEVFGQTITKNPNIQYILAINPQDIQTDPISFAIEDRCVEVYFDISDKQMMGISATPQDRFEIVKYAYQTLEIPYSIRTLQKCNLLTKEEFKGHLMALMKRRKEDFDSKVLNSPEFEAKLMKW